jgi:hypothetical protein
MLYEPVQLMENRARKQAEQAEETAHARQQEMIRLTLERKAAEVCSPTSFLIPQSVVEHITFPILATGRQNIEM